MTDGSAPMFIQVGVYYVGVVDQDRLVVNFDRSREDLALAYCRANGEESPETRDSPNNDWYRQNWP